MRLNDKLITSFIYEDNEYKIDLAYDNVLDVFDVLEDKALRSYEMAEICLALLLDDQPHTPSIEMWNYLYKNFINKESKQLVEYDRQGNPMPKRTDENKELIDLDKDAQYIYASFRQAYDINLYEHLGKMHWHEFQALLQGLPSETIMQRIIRIRAWEPSKGESKEDKEKMRELQKVYSLNDGDSEGVDE